VLPATPAPDGAIELSANTVTVPAGGQASVTVIIHPNLFDIGYVGGYVNATTTFGQLIRTPIGWNNAPVTHDLTIEATNLLGQPAGADPAQPAYVALVDINSGQSTFTPMVDGHWSMPLVEGDYALVVTDQVMTDDGGYVVTVLPAGPFTLSEPTTLKLDGSLAKTVELLPDLPGHGSVSARLGLSNSAGDWLSNFNNVVSFDRRLDDALAILPTADNNLGSWQLDLLGVLATPPGDRLADCSLDGKTVPDDVYALASRSGLSQADFVLTAETGDLAAVDVSHRHGGDLDTVQEVFTVAWPDAAAAGSVSLFSFPVEQPLPSQYRLWASPQLSWTIESDYPLTSGDGDPTAPIDSEDPADPTGPSIPSDPAIFVTPATVFPLGQISQLDIGGPVLTLNQPAGFETSRVADTMVVYPNVLSDGQGNSEPSFTATGLQGAAQTSLELVNLSSGESLIRAAVPPGVSPLVVPGLPDQGQEYELRQASLVDLSQWGPPISIAASWRWHSASQGSAEGRIEPLRSANIELPGIDAANRGATAQPIIVHTGMAAGAADLPLDELRLEQSTDGGVSWQTVTMKVDAAGSAGSAGGSPASSGPGSIVQDSAQATYLGEVVAPVGASVSLRLTVAGEGSSLIETMLDAYAVTDAPKILPGSAEWLDCSVDPEPTPPGGVDPNSPAVANPPKAVQTGGKVIDSPPWWLGWFQV
jgi:hypothetical protein